MEHSGISGQKFRTAFVLILVVAVSALFLAVTWPFLKPLLLGALLAESVSPSLPMGHAGVLAIEDPSALWSPY